MGGVLFSIEVTAQYFLVSLYWRCFLASVTGAIVSRLLYSWWHDDTAFGINSMLHSDDVSADPTQLLAYAAIGAVCGLAGAWFTVLNKRWMEFRKKNAKHWFLRNRFLWSTVFVFVFGLVSFPDSPVGHFMSKGQTASINELFQRNLSPEWHQPHLTLPFWSPNLGTLLLYIFFRFSFLVIGITLPLPCGVFAPCLAIGAGIGRVVGDAMGHILPHMSDNIQPGGYAVLGAASMAAGVTRTISSAILIFELTGGLQHVLPILIAVIIAFIVGQCFSVSIFESIGESKGLVVLPEFKNNSTWAKTAGDVMLVRHMSRLVVSNWKLAGMDEVRRAFMIWKARRRNTRENKRRGAAGANARDALRITSALTYRQLGEVLKASHSEDQYYPYVDGQGYLVGVLHRQQLSHAMQKKQQGHLAKQEAPPHHTPGNLAPSHPRWPRPITSQVTLPHRIPPHATPHPISCRGLIDNGAGLPLASCRHAERIAVRGTAHGVCVARCVRGRVCAWQGVCAKDLPSAFCHLLTETSY